MVFVFEAGLFKVLVWCFVVGTAIVVGAVVLGGTHAAWWRPCCLLVASVRGLEFLFVLSSAYRSQGPAMVVFLLKVVLQFVDLGAVGVLEPVLVLHMFVDLVVQGPA